MQEVNSEDLRKAVVSLRQQVSHYIDTVTELDVKAMKMQERISELEAELEKYREEEISEMDGEAEGAK